MPVTPKAAALALALCLLTGACGDDDGGVVARLQTCGLLSEGEVGALPFYAPTACYRACLRSGTCEELGDALCRTSIALLSECDQRCAFRCDDGALIAVEMACDGFEHCADGSDEAGCASPTCSDGTPIEPYQWCDGQADCADGSDEAGCVLDCTGQNPAPGCPPVPCDDGSTAPAGARCNGWEQCADGSDEAGCAELTLMCPMP